ncbi:hypothetical protein LN650_26235 [Klebsiella pneumoniae subsp. pneumoniae]|nr:hypothetical protein [Klebsiella pneumoniae subsp. pneumoniae]
MMGQLSQSQDLGRGWKSRHVTMLSIAGVIGASLFVGSSVAIAGQARRCCWPICLPGCWW